MLLEPPIALLTDAGLFATCSPCATAARQADRLFNRRVDPLVPRERCSSWASGCCRTAPSTPPLDESSVTIRGAALAEARGPRHRHLPHQRLPQSGAREACARAQSGQRHQSRGDGSHEVGRSESEYERAMLTLLNVYVKRLMASYIGEIDHS